MAFQVVQSHFKNIIFTIYLFFRGWEGINLFVKNTASNRSIKTSKHGSKLAVKIDRLMQNALRKPIKKRI